MEACLSAHHWAREFAQFGHTVRLMAPKFMAPYRLSAKLGKPACHPHAARGGLVWLLLHTSCPKVLCGPGTSAFCTTTVGKACDCCSCCTCGHSLRWRPDAVPPCAAPQTERPDKAGPVEGRHQITETV